MTPQNVSRQCSLGDKITPIWEPVSKWHQNTRGENLGTEELALRNWNLFFWRGKCSPKNEARESSLAIQWWRLGTSTAREAQVQTLVGVKVSACVELRSWEGRDEGHSFLRWSTKCCNILRIRPTLKYQITQWGGEAGLVRPISTGEAKVHGHRPGESWPDPLTCPLFPFFPPWGWAFPSLASLEKKRAGPQGGRSQEVGCHPASAPGCSPRPLAAPSALLEASVCMLMSQMTSCLRAPCLLFQLKVILSHLSCTDWFQDSPMNWVSPTQLHGYLTVPISQMEKWTPRGKPLASTTQPVQIPVLQLSPYWGHGDEAGMLGASVGGQTGPSSP